MCLSSFAPSSGNQSYTQLQLTPTVNQTGTANANVVLLDLKPTLTSLRGSLYGLLVEPTSATNGFGVSTPTANVDITGSSTTKSSLRIRNGTAPTSPNDGDIWYDGTNLKMRVGGTTKTFTLT
ncbi:MAG TPA: hypothetical protein VL728_06000 [Cyclobacteriaceae bacterium]|nr:hypothetical protein [Cyclobacteriaceae bacterium]